MASYGYTLTSEERVKECIVKINELSPGGSDYESTMEKTLQTLIVMADLTPPLLAKLELWPPFWPFLEALEHTLLQSPVQSNAQLLSKVVYLLSQMAVHPPLRAHLAASLDPIHTMYQRLKHCLAPNGDINLMLNYLMLLRNTTFRHPRMEDATADIVQLANHLILTVQRSTTATSGEGQSSVITVPPNRRDVVALSLASLFNLFYACEPLCTHIRASKLTLNPLLKLLLPLLSQPHHATILYSLGSLTLLAALRDSIGAKIFRADNLVQTFQLIFNLLNSNRFDDLLMPQYCVDMLSSMLRHQDVLLSFQRWEKLYDALSQLMSTFLFPRGTSMDNSTASTRSMLTTAALAGMPPISFVEVLLELLTLLATKSPRLRGVITELLLQPHFAVALARLLRHDHPDTILAAAEVVLALTSGGFGDAIAPADVTSSTSPTRERFAVSQKFLTQFAALSQMPDVAEHLAAFVSEGLFTDNGAGETSNLAYRTFLVTEQPRVQKRFARIMRTLYLLAYANAGVRRTISSTLEGETIFGVVQAAIDKQNAEAVVFLLALVALCPPKFDATSTNRKIASLFEKNELMKILTTAISSDRPSGSPLKGDPPTVDTPMVELALELIRKYSGGKRADDEHVVALQGPRDAQPTGISKELPFSEPPRMSDGRYDEFIDLLSDPVLPSNNERLADGDLRSLGRTHTSLVAEGSANPKPAVGTATHSPPERIPGSTRSSVKTSAGAEYGPPLSPLPAEYTSLGNPMSPSLLGPAAPLRTAGPVGAMHRPRIVPTESEALGVIARLEAQLGALMTEKMQLEERLEIKEVSLNHADHLIKENRALRVKAEQAAAELQAKLVVVERTESELRMVCDELRNKLQQSEQTIEGLRDELHQHQLQIMGLEEEAKGKEAQIEELRAQCTQIVAKYETKVHEVELLLKENATLHRDLEALESKRRDEQERAIKDASALNARIRELEQMAATTKADLDEARQREKQLSKALEASRTKIMQQAEKERQLADRCAELQKKMEELEDRNRRQAEELRTKEEENSKCVALAGLMHALSAPYASHIPAALRQSVSPAAQDLVSALLAAIQKK